MATDKQIAAARANGARSRGPKTPEGKARSARNATRHGDLSRTVLLKGESREGFEQLVGVIYDALKPANAFDELLIGKMAAAHWRQLRILNREKLEGESLTDREMRFDRQFFRSFDRYLRFQTFSAQTNRITPAPATPALAIEPENEPVSIPKRNALDPDRTASYPAKSPAEPEPELP
jgi:hypothetical protein